ncbi:MAG TPA: glycosyltransferase, partial [Erysipelothrix sp.]
MKGFLLLNSIIIMFVVIVKLNFKQDKVISYDKTVSRFQGFKKTNMIRGAKGSHEICERYGFSVDFVLFLLFVIVWLGWQLLAMRHSSDSHYRAWFIFVGVQALILMFFALFEPKRFQDLDQNYDVIVTIPVYNENPESLYACITSILNQSVKPKEIHIIDDGSNINYHLVKVAFYEMCGELGIYGTWHQQHNQGKRHAQMNALKHCKCKKENSIVLTVDSDGLLSSQAIEEGLKPFSDRKIQSVAGL